MGRAGMLEHYPIHFTGRRWPAATDGRVSAMLVPDANNADIYGRVSVADVEIRGDGRRWKTAKALGFWKTFSEIDPLDLAKTVNFVKRYGAPHQKPDASLQGQTSPPVRTISTHNWGELSAVLRLIGNCWQKEWSLPSNNGAEESGLDGVCNVRNGEPSEQVRRLINRDLAAWQPAVARFDSATGLRLDASSLADFMVASAVQHLFRRMPLKRCAFCTHWFAFERTNMKTCSDACRNALSRDNRSND
jgi:hypothetical protein